MIEKPIQSIGYIEGFYGKLLSWEDRTRILKRLRFNNIKYYFYSPKEDLNHRLFWRDAYKETWIKKFKKFLSIAKKNDVKIIFGLSPGLDFNFNNFKKNLKSHNDLQILIQKLIIMENIGVEHFAILFDDLQPNFNEKYPLAPKEGECHAIAVNEAMKKVKKTFYLVPRVYADEIKRKSNNYLADIGNKINKKINIFFCGKNIVSKNLNLSDIKSVRKVIPENNIIFWDNFYCNDYCPRRIFLGPWIGRNNLNNVFVNGTGMIEIDLLIIDIIKNCNSKKNKYLAWEEVIIKNNIPLDFFYIMPYFNNPSFGKSTILKKITVKNIVLKSIDKLLWNWKSPLSRELYPFFMSLKHDLLLQRKKLPLHRINKTQSVPLAELLIKNIRRLDC